MQDRQFEDKEFIRLLGETLSQARFDRYLHASNSDPISALKLYLWNLKLSEAFYLPLQMWEVALRNKLNEFLCWKYGIGWPFNERALRQLTKFDRRRVQEAIDRQQRRGKITVSTNSIVADLSAGFWVALFNEDYEVPFSWRYNITRVFPHDLGLTVAVVRLACNDLLNLRNRVAHHEPIYHLPLPQRMADLDGLLAAMCPAMQVLASSISTFRSTWNSKPS